jgi:molybdopterin-guanine dinucleotide biosynthesis protein A
MGVPKENLRLQNETMLERTIRILEPLTRSIIVVRSAQYAPSEPALPHHVVRDPHPYRGPLAGLITGLSAIAPQTPPTTWMIVTPCDHPHLSTPFLEHLVAQRTDSDDAIVLGTSEVLFPLPGLYRLRIRAIAHELAQDPSHGLKHLLRRVETRIIDPVQFRGVDPMLKSLTSVDSPDDWNRLDDAEPTPSTST